MLHLAGMDWITFIKWNGIVYGTWYGVNLLVDYMRISKGAAPVSEITEFRPGELDVEKPQIVRSKDYDHKEKDVKHQGFTENNKTPENHIQNAISFQAPIERQGIPLKEFLRTAHQYATKIYQPTI